jgi:hypothetical protein
VQSREAVREAGLQNEGYSTGAATQQQATESEQELIASANGIKIPASEVQYRDGPDGDGRRQNYGGLTGADHKGMMASSGGARFEAFPTPFTWCA